MANKYILEKSKNKLDTIYYLHNNKKLYLHSRYDPVHEAQTLLKAYDLQKYDFIIILGNGLGYVLNEICSMPHIKKVFVIEQDRELFQIFDKKTNGLSREKVSFIINKDLSEAVAQITAAFNLMDYKGFAVIEISSVIKINEHYFNSLKSVLHSELDKKINIQLTEAKLGIRLINSFFHNIKSMDEIKLIKIIQSQTKKENLIIVSAGFSLYKDLESLKALQEHCIIFSVDTALAYLLKERICPDAVFSMDPQYYSYLHFYQQGYHGPVIFDLFSGAAGLIPKNKSISFLINRNFISEILFAPQDRIDFNGGSITNFIMDFAAPYFKKIILVGLDLCYSDYNMYIPHSYLNRIFLKQNNRLISLQTKYLQFYLQRARRSITFKDKTYYSTFSMINYYQWFLNKIRANKNIAVSNNCLVDDELLKRVDLTCLPLRQKKADIFFYKKIYKNVLVKQIEEQFLKDHYLEKFIELIIISQYISQWQNFDHKKKAMITAEILANFKKKIEKI